MGKEKKKEEKKKTEEKREKNNLHFLIGSQGLFIIALYISYKDDKWMYINWTLKQNNVFF